MPLDQISRYAVARFFIAEFCTAKQPAPRQMIYPEMADGRRSLAKHKEL